MIEVSKKQRIMEAAAQLFRDKGYSATSMRDLAQAVHLQASSLYNHIASKQEILREICFNNAHRFNAGIREVEQTFSHAPERVKALISMHLEIATRDFTSITAFNDEWRHLEEPHLTEFRTLRKDYENRFKAILIAGMEAGQFKSVDPTIALHTLLSSLRWVYDWYQPGKAQGLDEIEQTILTMLLDSLSNK